MLSFNAPEEHYKLLNSFIEDTIVLDLEDSIANASINIRKKYKTKLPDAIIAAPAVVHSLTLITRNVSDFRNIAGLNVIDPHLH